MRIADLGRATKRKAPTCKPCRLASAVTRVEAMALGQHTIAVFADHFTIARANHWRNHDAIGCHGRRRTSAESSLFTESWGNPVKAARARFI